MFPCSYALRLLSIVLLFKPILCSSIDNGPCQITPLQSKLPSRRFSVCLFPQKKAFIQSLPLPPGTFLLYSINSCLKSSSAQDNDLLSATAIVFDADCLIVNALSQNVYSIMAEQIASPVLHLQNHTWTSFKNLSTLISARM